MYTLNNVLDRSDVLKNMFENGEIGLVGAFYKVETGEVDFVKELFKTKE